MNMQRQAQSVREYWQDSQGKIHYARGGHEQWAYENVLTGQEINQVEMPLTLDLPGTTTYKICTQKGYIRVVVETYSGTKTLYYTGNPTPKQLKALKDFGIEQGAEIRKGGKIDPLYWQNPDGVLIKVEDHGLYAMTGKPRIDTAEDLAYSGRHTAYRNLWNKGWQRINTDRDRIWIDELGPTVTRTQKEKLEMFAIEKGKTLLRGSKVLYSPPNRSGQQVVFTSVANVVKDVENRSKLKKAIFDQQTIVAREWAREFVKNINENDLTPDKDLMVSYFAGAIMAGYYYAENQCGPKVIDKTLNVFDAVKWAEKFMAVYEDDPTVATSDDAMTIWFANAISAGYNHKKREAKLYVRPKQHPRLLASIKRVLAQGGNLECLIDKNGKSYNLKAAGVDSHARLALKLSGDPDWKNPDEDEVFDKGLVLLEAGKFVRVSQEGPRSLFCTLHGTFNFTKSQKQTLEDLAVANSLLIEYDQGRRTVTLFDYRKKPNGNTRESTSVLKRCARKRCAVGDTSSYWQGGAVTPELLRTAGHGAGGNSGFLYGDRVRFRNRDSYEHGAVEFLPFDSKPYVVSISDKGTTSVREAHLFATPEEVVDFLGRKGFNEYSVRQRARFDPVPPSATGKRTPTPKRKPYTPNENASIERLDAPAVNTKPYFDFITGLTDARQRLKPYGFEVHSPTGDSWITGLQYKDGTVYQKGSPEWSVLYGDVLAIAEHIVPIAQKFHQEYWVPHALQDRTGVLRMPHLAPKPVHELKDHSIFVLKDKKNEEITDPISWHTEKGYNGHAQTAVMHLQNGSAVLAVFEIQCLHSGPTLSEHDEFDNILHLANQVKQHADNLGIPVIVANSLTASQTQGSPRRRNVLTKTYGKEGLAQKAFNQLYGNRGRRVRLADELKTIGPSLGSGFFEGYLYGERRETGLRGQLSILGKNAN